MSDNTEEKGVPLTVDEIIKQEGDIPVLVNSARNRHKPMIFRKGMSDSERAKYDTCFCCEDLIDSQKVYDLVNRDYKFFQRWKKYDKFSHFHLNQEPFSHAYEKKCWDLTPFNKFYGKIREFATPLNSDPFSHHGTSRLFEFETLYNPKKCNAYVLLTNNILEENMRRFMLAAVKFNADVYEDITIDEISLEESQFSLPSFFTRGSKPRMISKKSGLDEIPDVTIDRHEWPSEYLDSKMGEIDKGEEDITE